VDLIINKMCCVGLVIGELPIILFNLDLDGQGKQGTSNKVEEILLNSFINSKNNLSVFAKGVKEIELIIKKGLEEYEESKVASSKLLDDEEDILEELDKKFDFPKKSDNPRPTNF